MSKLDDKLQLDYVSYRIANDIADQFTTGFCNDKMVKKFEKIVKEQIKTLKLEQETKDTELRHLRAFNEELHTKYKEDIIDVAKKNTDAKTNTELRDHFAGLGMLGTLSADIEGEWSDYSHLANHAYQIADVMLKEREKE